MRIGILGTRGIPNAYGGFEQFAQYLAHGLVKRKHEVWVYNSSEHPYKDSEWNGVNIIHCKDWENKIGTAGQFVYDYNCINDARKREYDILLQLGYTSNSVWFRLWPKRSINIVNMDGLEWKRTKYGNLTQKFLKMAESWAASHADILVADSIGIQSHLKRTYGKKSFYIPYGADLFGDHDSSFLETYKLKVEQYNLIIARMEPENNIEMIIQGHLSVEHQSILVIIGSTNNKYGKYLTKKYNHAGVRFLGAIYDQNTINNLRYHSKIYFHGHSVGGTNPSLLEAMACRCFIAAHNNVFNKTILEESADFFSTASDVANIIGCRIDDTIKEKRKEQNEAKIKTLYNWETIINSYEELFVESYNSQK